MLLIHFFIRQGGKLKQASSYSQGKWADKIQPPNSACINLTYPAPLMFST